VTIDLLHKRALLTQNVRNFFIGKGYLEVETPILSPYLLPEAYLEVFKTSFIQPEYTLDYYLIPSPEIWMKKLLAKGTGNLFQITKAFRNYESIGRYHNPEFTLLEYYTVGADYLDSMKITEAFFQFLCDKSIGRNKSIYSFPFLRLSMREAFLEYTGLDLSLNNSFQSMKDFAAEFDISFKADDTWEQLFNRIFLNRVEPHLPKERPLFLYDYPSKIETLARTKGNFAERWELYISGIEIANCFTEERAKEKLELFIKREEERKKKSIVHHKVDYGVPEEFSQIKKECSGVALGMDRLFMVLFNLNSIEDAIAFPFIMKDL
jgi:lysyl-tRNA synthetase class 2